MPRQRDWRLKNAGEPYLLTVRYECLCPQTGKRLNVGDRAVYFPKARKAYHVESEAGRNALRRQFVESIT